MAMWIPDVRRGAAVLAMASLCLSMAVPALAAASKPKPKNEDIRFEYGKDISSWYWSHQVNEEATAPVGLPPPVPPVSQRVTLPNPQRPDTLPVAVFEGQHERMSAIKFELSERGVTPGSTIEKLVLRIEESRDPNEHPSFRPEAAKIQACRLSELLTPGENERFEDRPKHVDGECVDGKRETPAGATPAWTFDLTKIAKPWGADPFSENNGVLLLGVLQNQGLQETWQVNLKIPARDDAATTDKNEYEQTKARVQVTLAYVPGDDLTVGSSSGGTEGSASSGATTGTGSSGVPTGSTSSFGTSTGSVTPSTDLTGAGSVTGSPGTSPAAPAAPTTQAAPVARVTPKPRIPGSVWLLIPLGLLALSAVRSAVMEPVGGPRPDGVIVAIRRRNAERRGGPLRELSDPMARVGAVFRHGAAAVGRGLEAVGGRLSQLTRRTR
jgi:hypothetical protein